MSLRHGAALVVALGGLLLAGFGTDRAPLEPPRRVLVPAGSFDRGSDTAAVRHGVALCRKEHLVGQALGACQAEVFAPELPFVSVYVPAFEIDRLEVTRADYSRCVRAGACVPPRLGSGDARLGRGRHPVVGVTAHDAEDHCRFVGGRLPTDDEWEKAARGDRDARTFPWGDLWDPRLANHGGEGGRPGTRDATRFLAPVGSYLDGASPYGALDMAGNVWEWTASAFSPGMRVRGTPPRASTRSIRGGSFLTSAIMLRVAYRAGLDAGEHAPDVGFRCAYDVR